MITTLNWIDGKAAATQHFTIYFENKQTATAAAQEVFVETTLSEAFDWSTFKLDAISVGNEIYDDPFGCGNGVLRVENVGFEPVFWEVELLRRRFRFGDFFFGRRSRSSQIFAQLGNFAIFRDRGVGLRVGSESFDFRFAQRTTALSLVARRMKFAFEDQIQSSQIGFVLLVERVVISERQTFLSDFAFVGV